MGKEDNTIPKVHTEPTGAMPAVQPEHLVEGDDIPPVHSDDAYEASRQAVAAARALEHAELRSVLKPANGFEAAPTVENMPPVQSDEGEEEAAA